MIICDHTCTGALSAAGDSRASVRMCLANFVLACTTESHSEQSATSQAAQRCSWTPSPLPQMIQLAPGPVCIQKLDSISGAKARNRPIIIPARL